VNRFQPKLFYDPHDINHLHFLFWIFDGGWLVIGYLIPQHNGGSNVFTEG
jgi:hypothetical protein